MRRSLILVLLLFVLGSRPVAAQDITLDDKLFALGTALTIGLNAFDGWTTYRCTHDFPQRCHEAGPLFAPISKHYGPVAAIGVKFAGNAALITAVALIRRQKPEWHRLTTGSMFTMAGVSFAVDVHNYRALQQLRIP